MNNFSENDLSLILQMMKAGRHDAVFDLMPDYNLDKSRRIIKSMGNKWCCHPENAVKRLDAPLPVLNRGSKILAHD